MGDQMIINDSKSGRDSLFYNVFLSAQIGQVIVDENLNITLANRRMFEYFGLKPLTLMNVPFGRAFRCKEFKIKCGQAEKCRQCGIFKAIHDLSRDDAPADNKEIHYYFYGKNHLGQKWFLLNGSWVAGSCKRYAVLQFTDITYLKQKEKRLELRLTLDPATGVINKQSLMNSIQRLMKSQWVGRSYTVCMVDFDKFKAINDQYGHLVGDQVLKTFSNIARQHIRKNDILGRFGGEEFLFVFMGSDEEQSLKILRRIHRELQDHFMQESISVTFSAGAAYVANEPRIPAELLNDIDKRLYQAKQRGRGRAVSSTGETLFIGSG